MNSVGIYARLSVEDMDKQGNVDSRSFINQKNMLVDYCKDRGWTIYDIYVDDDISGMERNRPAFQRMLKDCEDGKIDTVLCKDQSRFARDDVIIKEYLHTKFFIWGVRFIGISDNVDSSSPDFMDNSSIRGFFNEWYVRDISKKIRATFDSKRKRGQFSHSAPYGYMKDPKDNNHLIPDPEVRDIVVRIFESYVSGKSLKTIAEELNAEGIPSPIVYKTKIYPNYKSRYKDNVWSSDGIRTMLKNEAYIGNCVQGKSVKVSYRTNKKVTCPKDKWVRVEGTHEPIISMELWEKSRSRGQTHARASRNTQEVQPLSRKVICAVCGKPMRRFSNYYYRESTKEKIHVCFYRCPDVINGKGTCDNIHCINYKELKTAVLDAINNAIQAYCSEDCFNLSDMQKDNMTQLEKRAKQITEQVEKIQNRIDNTYRDKLDGVISGEEYLRYKEQFAAEAEELQERLSEVNEKLRQLAQRRENVEYGKMLAEKYSHVTELTRPLTEEFLESVVVGKTDENGEREVTVNLKV